MVAQLCQQHHFEDVILPAATDAGWLLTFTIDRLWSQVLRMLSQIHRITSPPETNDYFVELKRGEEALCKAKKNEDH